MPPLPLGAVLTVLAREDPDRTAIVCDGESVTRAELEGRANRAARALAARGVGRDDLVAVVLPNCIDFYVATLAAWKVGATPLPVSHRLPDAELGPVIELADPAFVIGVDPSRVGGRPGVAAGVPLGGEGEDGPLPAVAPRYARALTSGGSTGRPKVIVSHQPGTMDPDEPANGMRRGGVQLVPGPLFHNAPFTTSTTGLLHGNTLVVMTRFDPRRWLELVEQYRVTWVQIVPTMLHRIWRLPPEERLSYDLSSLEVVFSTGGAFPAWLKQAWMEWIGPEKILEIYGSSEAYGSTVVTGEEALRKPGTVGRPRFGPPRILDEDGKELGPNQIGLVYFERPAEPSYHYLGAESRVLDGWETLGDMGYLDEDGYLFLADRRVDMIVTGGENVFPAEVEAALERHPAVRSCAVIGLPDEDLGQRVHAIVDVGSDGAGSAPLGPAELAEHLAVWLAPFKRPRSYEIVSEPLRSDAGKVRRSQLRDERL